MCVYNRVMPSNNADQQTKEQTMNTTKMTAEQNRVAYIAALAAAIWEDSGFGITYAEAKAQALAASKND